MGIGGPFNSLPVRLLNTIQSPADCYELALSLPDKCVDVVFGSPPYENARHYGGKAKKLKGQDWVDWMMKLWREFDRISRGIVGMVVEGRTVGRRYSATPHLLAADLHRAGYHLRKDYAYVRWGIPGSGGDDGHKNRWEPVIVTKPPGKLFWADNLAMGKPPKHKPGGACSHRTSSGKRVAKREYKAPAIANPGNIIECTVGGGHMGDYRAHDSEAPFHVRIAEFFVRSYCPPGGVIFDPFMGSGTVAEMAVMHGRNYLGCELQEEQAVLARERAKKAHDAYAALQPLPLLPVAS